MEGYVHGHTMENLRGFLVEIQKIFAAIPEGRIPVFNFDAWDCYFLTPAEVERVRAEQLEEKINLLVFPVDAADRFETLIEALEAAWPMRDKGAPQ